jgi:hypothetical protein
MEAIDARRTALTRDRNAARNKLHTVRARIAELKGA